MNKIIDDELKRVCSLNVGQPVWKSKGCEENNNPLNPKILKILIQTIELAELESGKDEPDESLKYK